MVVFKKFCLWSILEIPLLWRGGEAGVVDTIAIKSIGW
jgi:hypothetical protein